MRFTTPLFGATALALVFCAASLAGARSLSQESQPETVATAAGKASGLVADPAIRWGTLPNGMRYAIMRNQNPPKSASLRLRIDAGSLYEKDDQRGIAHFIEHMVFNGTESVPEGEFVRRLERHGLRFGADTNASTGFTQTVYKLDLPVAADAAVGEALFLLREVADKATLRSDAIERERSIILSEERARATPTFRTFADELSYLFPGQRVIDRMPIGLVDTIRTAPRERFVEFYDAYYRPERATLIAVGDFDVEAMEKRIVAQFGSWVGNGPAGGDPDPGQVGKRSADARIFVETGGANRLSVNWTRPFDTSRDTREKRIARLAETVAMQILNRRYARLASGEKTPPFVAASINRSAVARSGEAVQISATTRPDEWKNALTAVEQEWRRLLEHGVSQAEIDLAIGGMRTAWETAVSRAGTRRSFQLSDQIVKSLEEREVFAAPAFEQAIFEEAAAALTAARVRDAARALQTGGNGPLIHLTSPKPIAVGREGLLAAYRASQAVAVAAPATREAVAWPYENFGTPGKVVEQRVLGDGIDATLVRFANGVRLTVKPTKFTANEIHVIVNAGEGRASFPQGTPSPAWALGRGAFISAGLKKIGFEDMREALSDRNIGARSILLDDALQIAGITRPQDLEVQLEMMTAYLSDSRWDPSAWNRIRATAGSRHRQYEATPGGVYEREAAQLLHDGDRRWGTPTQAEMEASSIDDLRKLIERPLAEGPIEVIIIGDVTVEDAIAKVAGTLGALPQRREPSEPLVVPKFPKGSPTPVRLTHSGRADQGLAMITWPTAGQYRDLRDTRALAVLSAVYRLRLTEKVREEQGATYSPAVGQSTSATFDDFGFFFGRIEAPPALLDRFLTDAAAIAADLAANLIGGDELERARRPIIEGLRRSRVSNAYWRFALAGMHENPRVAESIRTQEAAYDAITAEVVREAAKRYLRPDTAWKLIIAPRATAKQL